MSIRVFTALILLLVAASPASAGRYFTNQDLEKYKKASDTKKPAPEENIPAVKYGPPPKENWDYRPKKYVIPYSGSSRRIVIQVTFNNRVAAPMLLDTGATGMLISLRLAERLGVLDNDRAKLLSLVGGVGGMIPAIFTILDSIRVGDVEYDFIPTTISFLDFQGFDGLIGMDFMTNYSVFIDTRKRRVVFEELPESSNMPAGRSETWWRDTFRKFKSMRAEWRRYRERLYNEDSDSLRVRELRAFADSQYENAEDLYDRLNVYASEYSVPLEWRR